MEKYNNLVIINIANQCVYEGNPVEGQNRFKNLTNMHNSKLKRESVIFRTSK